MWACDCWAHTDWNQPRRHPPTLAHKVHANIYTVVFKRTSSTATNTFFPGWSRQLLPFNISQHGDCKNGGWQGNRKETLDSPSSTNLSKGFVKKNKTTWISNDTEWRRKKGDNAVRMEVRLVLLRSDSGRVVLTVILIIRILWLQRGRLLDNPRKAWNAQTGHKLVHQRLWKGRRRHDMWSYICHHCWRLTGTRTRKRAVSPKLWSQQIRLLQDQLFWPRGTFSHMLNTPHT